MEFLLGKFRNPRSRGSSGFTVLELMVVTAIIAVVAAMIMPALQSVKKKTQAATCANNLKQIGLAISMYMNDHDETFPPCQHYISWAGGSPEVYMEGPSDLQYALNDYIGSNDGTHKNNMWLKTWVCPTAAQYGRKGVDAVSPFPYRLGRFGTPGSWWGGKGSDITYRYNSRTTRDRDNMFGDASSTRSHPQRLASLKTPSQAALVWDFPDNLSLYEFSTGVQYVMHGSNPEYTTWQGMATFINCLFVDGHIEMIRTNTDVYTPVPQRLSWYAGWGTGQGWDGAVVP